MNVGDKVYHKNYGEGIIVGKSKVDSCFTVEFDRIAIIHESQLTKLNESKPRTLGKVISYGETNRDDILMLIDVALDTGDIDWFNELVVKLNATTNELV